jgi:hypothetical protein
MEPLNLFDIKFPIYGITNTYKNIWTDLNVLYIETNTGTYVLDNKNIVGDTLGERRLKIKNSKLYIPRKVYYNIAQLLKSKHTVFIDKYGILFKYKKTQYVPLKYYKIENIDKAEDGQCILAIPKLPFYHKTTCRIAYSINYLGLLDTPFGYILYELSEYKKSDSKRKI